MKTLISLPYKVLEIPNINISKPSWLKPPTPMEMIFLITFAYLLIIGGALYDLVTDSSCFGRTADNFRGSRTVTILPKSVNIQHLLDRLARSSVFSAAGIGFLILDLKYNPSNLNKNLFIFVVFVCILFSIFTTWLFNRNMYPNYCCVRCF